MGKFSVSVLLACFIIAMYVFIAFAAPEEGVIVSPQMGEKITIDGKLDDWSLNLFKDNEKIILTKKEGFINAGAIDNDKDFSSFIYALYDNDNLYVASAVIDDATEKGFAGSSNWQNDCIEIWIDGAGDQGTMTDRGGNDPDNYQLNVDVNGEPYIYRNDDAAKLLAQIESSAETDGTNYTLEVRIPFSAIPELDINGKKFIGFGISFVDSDKSVWSHIIWQGEVENEPTQWGKLEFSQQKLAVESHKKLPITWGKLK